MQMPGMQMFGIWQRLLYCRLGKGWAAALPPSQQTQHTKSEAMSWLHK